MSTPCARHFLRHDSEIDSPIAFLRNRIVLNALPSLVKFWLGVFISLSGRSRSTPINDHVPEEM
jgi:hypothetical protein